MSASKRRPGRANQGAVQNAYDSDKPIVARAAACFSWRWCGCTCLGDCLLWLPLPVQADDLPCPGEFGPSGAFRPHCAVTGVAS